MWELHPETAAWSTRTKTNTILADIYDELAQINANLVALGTGRPAKTPKQYPRPVKKDPENEKHIGSGALPPNELEKWMEEKRREHARSSAGNDHSNPGT